jgi:ribosome-binding ATPase YchF (GTP1/OBG family)
MKIGIVGRPSCGKSTFFKAATLIDVKIASYPFTTISPNSGMAYVKIKDLAAEFGKVSNPREGYVKQGWRFVPFELMDVAGLVEGASEGKGLGNEFLNDLSAADAFIHVVDMSGEFDGAGKPVPDGNYDPSLDIKIIERELDLWYVGILKKVWKLFARMLEMQHSNFAEAVAKQFSGLKVSPEDVKHVVLKSNVNPEHPSKWTEEEIFKFAQMLRRYTKPMVIAANKVDRPNGGKNYEKIKSEFDYPIVACFADGELALREADKHGLIFYIPGEKTFEAKKELNEKQKQALDNIQKTINEFGSTGVQEVLNKTVLDVLKYICIFPAGDKLCDSKGNVLPDCYLMKQGSTALDFAYRLHSDIGKNFVKAIDVRTKKAVGKEHQLKHMDGFEIITK